MKRNLIAYLSSILAVAIVALVVSASTFITENAYGAPGDLFASINGNNQNGGGSIYQYTPTGAQSTFVSGLDRPRGLVFDGAGNLFVATTTLDDSLYYHGAIFKITPDGIMSTFATGFSPGFFLQGLALDSAGNLFVGAGDVTIPSPGPSQAGTIYKVTPDGTVSTFGTFGSIGDTSRNLVFDKAGNLYVSDAFAPTIFKFTPEGVSSTFADSTKFISPQDPAGLAFDRFGNLFVSTADSIGNGEILEFAPDGTGTTLFTGLTNQPRGIAFDGAGNLFVAEVSNTTTGDILKFTPGGAGGVETVFASGIGRPQGNGGPEYLAFPLGTSADTPVGSNVTVNMGVIGFTGITLTFPQVTVDGTTTVTPIDPSSAGTLPSGYELTGGNLAFEITTTATYTTPPPIIIAFQVPSVNATTFSQLRVLHNEGGTLLDRTATDPAPNPTTQTIYASVSSLSPFVIAKFATPTNMNQCKNGGWQTHVRANGTRFKNQGDCIQYVNTGQ